MYGKWKKIRVTTNSAGKEGVSSCAMWMHVKSETGVLLKYTQIKTFCPFYSKCWEKCKNMLSSSDHHKRQEWLSCEGFTFDNIQLTGNTQRPSQDITKLLQNSHTTTQLSAQNSDFVLFFTNVRLYSIVPLHCDFKKHSWTYVKIKFRRTVWYFKYV